MSVQQMNDMRVMAWAIVRKRAARMRRDGELGGGGPSLENLVLIAGAVVIGLGLIAWITVKITQKESTVNP